MPELLPEGLREDCRSWQAYVGKACYPTQTNTYSTHSRFASPKASSTSAESSTSRSGGTEITN